jgi:hypothetical protein
MVERYYWLRLLSLASMRLPVICLECEVLDSAELSVCSKAHTERHSSVVNLFVAVEAREHSFSDERGFGSCYDQILW